MFGFLALLLLTICSFQTATAQSRLLTLSISTRSMPAAVGQPLLLVDGEERSVLPAVIPVSLSPSQTIKIDIWGDQAQHYSFVLVKSNEDNDVRIDHFTDACQAERATPTVSFRENRI